MMTSSPSPSGSRDKRNDHILLLYPLLIGIYPTLFLYAQNKELVWSIREMAPSIGWTWLATVGIWLGLCWAGFKARQVAPAITLALFSFYNYQRFHRLAIVLPGSLLWVTAAKLLAAGAILFICWLLITGRWSLPRRGHQWLNLVSGILLLGWLVSVLPFEFQRYRQTGASRDKARGPLPSHQEPLPPGSSDNRPNIFDIILDGYADSSILKDLYQWDNSQFEQELAARGFHPVPNARANYPQTVFSLASTLNLEYLNDLGRQYAGETRDRLPAAQRLRDSRVMRFLRDRGYRTVALKSGYYLTEMLDVDLYLDPLQLTLRTPFQTAVLYLTPLPALFSKLYPLRYNEFEIHRQRIRKNLAHLAAISDEQKPVYVFAHITAPHPPFVFGPQGEARDSNVFFIGDGDHFYHFSGTTSAAEYRRRYLDQLHYMNSLVIPAVDQILQAVSRPTVILLRADHGPGSSLVWDSPEKTNLRERFSVLLAVRLPDGDPSAFYPGMSLVNLYRLLFTRLFSVPFDPLPDECYFSTWYEPYRFIPVTDRLDRTGPQGPPSP